MENLKGEHGERIDGVQSEHERELEHVRLQCAEEAAKKVGFHVRCSHDLSIAFANTRGSKRGAYLGN